VNEHIIATLLFIAEMFQESLSETRITGYCEALSDLPEQEVVSAMQESVKRCKFFPRVAEIRDLVQDASKEREKERQAQRRQTALDRYEGYRIQWENSRKELPLPIPIKSMVEKVTKQLEVKTPEDIESRKRMLREQAKNMSESSGDERSVSE
jgi:hypothetical protein